MPRKVSRSKPSHSTSRFATEGAHSPMSAIIITGLLAATLGAAVTYSVLPRHADRAVARAAAPAKPQMPPVAAEQSRPQAAGTPSEEDVPPPQLVLDLPSNKVALNLGNWYSDHKNWPIAALYYEEAVRRGYGNADVLTDLGNAYRFSGHPQQALNEYRTAHKEDPNHQASLFNQGALYAIDMNVPDKAVGVWHDYVKHFPNGTYVEEARRLIEEVKAHSGLTTGASVKSPGA